jgi:hypothetical protein
MKPVPRTLLRVSELRGPMAKDLMWANIARPRVPLCYLDLNHVINMAISLVDPGKAPAGSRDLYDAAKSAADERRVVFPMSATHFQEVSKIADRERRVALTAVFEQLSGFQYMLGRPMIARLEMDVGIRAMLEEPQGDPVPLIRPTMGQAFGVVGGLTIGDGTRADRSDALRAVLGEAKYEEMMATLHLQFERHLLKGPDDAERAMLLKNPAYDPDVFVHGMQSRLDYELDTRATLDAHPDFPLVRIRDAISGREFHHEWMEPFVLMLREFGSRVTDEFPSVEQFRRLQTAMPHHQVAISIKTRYHRNRAHRWKVNDIADIDALSVAYAYCEAVFTDKAARAALADSTELRALGTFLPRKAVELIDWLATRPAVSHPDELVRHPALE